MADIILNNKDLYDNNNDEEVYINFDDVIETIKNSLNPDYLNSINDYNDIEDGYESNENDNENEIELYGNITSYDDIHELNLSDNMIIGSISEKITIFNNLQYLDLSKNKLSGDLPSNDIWKFMNNLLIFNISDNEITGNIPLEFCQNLTKLKCLIISNNKMSFEIPQYISKLADLEIIDLSGNNIYGKIPHSFYSLTNIKSININNNNIDFGKESIIMDSLSHDILKMKNLTVLIIENHGLKGEYYDKIPLPYNNSFFTFNDKMNFSLFDNITSISLKGNNFYGCVPESLFKIKNLERLDLSYNSFDYIGKIGHKKLKFMDLSFNIISSEFLLNDDGLPSLNYLYIKNNNFYGSIEYIYNISSALTIDISNNNFKGKICSKSLSKLDKVGYLNISNNNFEGNIPLFKSKYIYKFNANNNKFNSIDLNTLLDYMPSIIDLNVSNNNIKSKIFPIKKTHKVLKYLNISNNKIYDQIDESILLISSINKLDISNNKFFGYIPNDIVKLDKLDSFIINNNNIYGHLPYDFDIRKYKNISISSNHNSIYKNMNEDDIKYIKMIEHKHKNEVNITS